VQEKDMDLDGWFHKRTAGFLLHAIHDSGVYIRGLWKVTRRDSPQLACYGSLLKLPDGGEITA
jgi:hypothetical protein